MTAYGKWLLLKDIRDDRGDMQVLARAGDVILGTATFNTTTVDFEHYNTEWQTTLTFSEFNAMFTMVE